MESAEEILKKYVYLDGQCGSVEKTDAIKAMKEYAIQFSIGCVSCAHKDTDAKKNLANTVYFMMIVFLITKQTVRNYHNNLKKTTKYENSSSFTQN